MAAFGMFVLLIALPATAARPTGAAQPDFEAMATTLSGAMPYIVVVVSGLLCVASVVFALTGEPLRFSTTFFVAIAMAAFWNLPQIFGIGLGTNGSEQGSPSDSIRMATCFTLLIANIASLLGNGIVTAEVEYVDDDDDDAPDEVPEIPGLLHANVENESNRLRDGSAGGLSQTAPAGEDPIRPTSEGECAPAPRNQRTVVT